MFFLNPSEQSSPKRQVFSAPKGQRIYALGDIHGRADLLAALQRTIIQDSADNEPLDNTAIYLGDYLDRGPFVRDTLNHVINGLPDHFTTYWLRGNHEQVFLDFLQNPAVLPAWLDIGGLWTLTSYNLSPAHLSRASHQAEQVRDDLLASMPAAHLDFLRALPLYTQLGDYLFVHAGIRPNIPLERQDPHDLLWLRSDAITASSNLPFMVVHGHTIERQPDLHSYRLGIDTGAFATGVLTCAVFEGQRIRFLDTSDH